MNIVYFCAVLRASAAIRGGVANAVWLFTVLALALVTACSQEKANAGPVLASAPGPEGNPSLRQPGDAFVGGGTTCPGAPGCPCVTGDDCWTLCVETPEGNQCARTCEGDCSAPFVCDQRSVPGADNVFLCLPRWARLCEPCKDSAMCAGAIGSQDAVCIDYGGKNGAFCGATCLVDADCPGGYSCGEATSIEGQKSKQCLRAPEADGSIQCPCDDRAIKNELSTVCHADLLNGACPGDRWCSPEGLTECSAGALELCDGKDNDCNGLTDDAVCDDKNPCTDDACVVATGLCVHNANTAPCEDDNPCTLATVCDGGACGSGSPLDCDDGNPCSADTCAQDCVHTLLTGTPCDDGDGCTVADACLSGGCAAGAPKSCDDGSLCSSDSCDPATGICHFENNALACDDGNECTVDDACAGGGCGGAPAQCDDKNLCTSDACDPTVGCTHKANLLPCEDGNSCTVSDGCAQGACKPGPLQDAAACDDDNPCTSDGCSPKLGCTHANSAGACDDGNPCTKNDSCLAGGCASGQNTCSCSVDADCAKQDDANKCNGALFCDKSGPDWQCKVSPATVVTCDASSDSPCTKNHCDPANGQCGFIFLNQGKPCDADASVCTVGDVCSNGKCAAGVATPCEDGNPCTNDSCDPKAGCLHAHNTLACDDGNPCTVNDACAASVCLGAATNAQTMCDDADICTTDACDAKLGCTHAANMASCDDGNACTQGDACSNGGCSGSALPCNDGNLCTSDTCNPASGCVHLATNLACDDGNFCTTNDLCTGTACKGSPADPAVLCDDGNACTSDACSPGIGCVHGNTGNPCDDGNACTVGDVCSGGKCESGGDTCACASDIDCAAAEDGNLCNGTLHCYKGELPYACKVKPGSVVTCDSSADSV